MEEHPEFGFSDKDLLVNRPQARSLLVGSKITEVGFADDVGSHMHVTPVYFVDLDNGFRLLFATGFQNYDIVGELRFQAMTPEALGVFGSLIGVSKKT